MSEAILSKIKSKSAQEILKDTKISERWQHLLHEKPRPSDFLDDLLDRGELADAARFLALALPAREAVWWGCLCVFYARGRSMTDTQREALRRAVAWVQRDTHQHAYAARQAAQIVGTEVPSGLLASAAYFAMPDPLQPGYDPSACARAVVQALRLASNSDKHEPSDLLRHFLVIGIGIASGKHVWVHEPTQDPPRLKNSQELWTPNPES